MKARIARRISLAVLVVLAATTLTGCGALESMAGTYFWYKWGKGTLFTRNNVPYPTPEQIENEKRASGSSTAREQPDLTPMQQAYLNEDMGKGVDPDSIPNLNPDRE